MKIVDQIRLSEFFKSIKKPQYVLGTTYTLSLAFFESVVYPLIDRSALKHCLIITDRIGYQRALDEAPALQGAAQGYLITTAPVAGAFHAKVWLVSDEDRVSLLVGSGNLTQSGFMDNAELFDVIEFSRNNAPPVDLLQDILRFVRGLKAMWSDADARVLYCAEVLGDIANHLNGFKARPGPMVSMARFLSSFDSPIINQLPNNDPVAILHVAAPYFGGQLDGIRLFQQRYPGAALSVYPAVHGDSIDLPLTRLTKEIPKSRVAALDLGKHKHRFAHLKLYGAETNSSSARTSRSVWRKLTRSTLTSPCCAAVQRTSTNTASASSNAAISCAAVSGVCAASRS